MIPEQHGNDGLGGFQRAIGALGCTLVVLGVALGAYAAHGAASDQVVRLERASLYLMLHGAAVAALLLSRPVSALRISSCALIVLGISLFSGSLISAALFGASAVLAPVGGVMLMLGWLCAGVTALFSKHL